MNNAQPTLSSAAASNHGAASPSLELLEARQLRDALKVLLRREQAAMAEFLVALSDFDRRRGWEALGHAGLFAFLISELGLSKSAAYYRRSAAELLQRFPEVIEPLREGQLCLSTIGELAKVLTEQNRATITPRFFGLSAREAQELVAELQPRHVPSTRMIVTRPFGQPAAPARFTQPMLSLTSASASPSASDSGSDSASEPAPSSASASALASDMDPNVVPPWRFPTSGIANGGGADGGVLGLLPRRYEIVPLTANVRRVHFNVDGQVVKKLKDAREGLSRSIPGATMEQVLEAALDLLLEKQARARGLVKRPRTSFAAAAPRAERQTADATARRLENPTLAEGQQTQSGNCSVARPEGRAISPPTKEPPPPRRAGPRETIPAAVRRAVWERDSGRCTWPLDGGGCCGSTHRLELDHVIPWAEWGPSTVENLRVVCGRHNALAARRAFGERRMRRYRDGSCRPSHKA